MRQNKRKLSRINSVGTFAQQKPVAFTFWVLISFCVGTLDGELVALAQTGNLHPWLATLIVSISLLWLATFPLDYIAAHNKEVTLQDYWDKHWAD
jgi:hypothetical protein